MKKRKNQLMKQPKTTSSKRIKDRQPMLMVVCGETGVGKTYRTVQEIKQYVQDSSATQKKGRKVLIFDVNDDDYTRFLTIDPNHVKEFQEVRIRRIRPITRTGKMMTLTQKRQIVEKIVAEFTNGLIVLEDIDKFMVGAKGQEVVGVLCANRHSDLDILISHQSIAKITTTEWQNMTWLRLHKQVDDISRYRNRIPNYPLVRIATFIVEEQYNLANEAFERNEIDEKQFQIRKSFFVYLDMRRLKIKGCSKAAFVRATKRYIDQEENKKVKLLLQETTMDEKQKYNNRKTAVIQLIHQKMRYHQAA
ncbi:MAG: hypothetical protein RJQ00_06010 [Vicingaceae bacterium]